MHVAKPIAPEVIVEVVKNLVRMGRTRGGLGQVRDSNEVE
jgi:hypothetical protein